MSSNEVSLKISIPHSDAPIHIKCRPVEKRTKQVKEQEEQEEQCSFCGEDVCWCSAVAQSQQKQADREKLIAREVKRLEREEKRRAARQERERVRSRAIMAKRYEHIMRKIRMHELREQHAEQIKQLKANPLTWVERPYLFGRFETLLSIMRSRAAFANIKDEQVVALMPAYAVWLWTAPQGFNRWQSMNCFVNIMERRDK